MRCGLIVSDPAALPAASRALRAAGAEAAPERLIALGADPAANRAMLDAALDDLDGRRLILALDRAHLVALLQRLLRRGDLLTVETAVLSPLCASLVAQGMPTELAAAARLAVHGAARPVGLIRDDSGQLMVDSARLTPWRDPTSIPPPAQPPSRLRPGYVAISPLARQSLWARAYVDDEPLCDGDIRRLTVTRVAPDRLRAEVEAPPGARLAGGRSGRGRLGLGRRRAVEGRALQLACDEALIVSDGISRERPRSKRIWWAEPTFWRVAMPTPGQAP
ncbi:MAG: hypothetical protein LBQ06_06150 [Frankiaceae bacterium]|jgi:hypothetical protein|nr:hypothetical protein [Frankiaceae bacterium]